MSELAILPARVSFISKFSTSLLKCLLKISASSSLLLIVKNEVIKLLRAKTLNSYIRGIMQILLIQSKICHIFHYHVNIISKLMTEFVTELVETVHFFGIVTNFSVQAMRN